MKIKIKESCGRQFLAAGRVFLKKGQEKEYEDCQELRMLIEKGYVQVIENKETVKAEVPKKKGRKKKTE